MTSQRQVSRFALRDIDKGIELGTSLPQIAYYDRAVALINLQRFTEAYYDLKKSEAADPSFAPTQAVLKDFTVVKKPVAQD